MGLNTAEKTNKLIMTGLMTGIITIATMVLMIPVPFSGGYVHLGDSMIFIAVLLLGWKYGAVAAGIGSALADIFSSFVSWAPWTLCIKGVMAMLMGLVIEKCITNKKNILIASGITIGFWVVFNIVINRIVLWESQNNASALLSDEVADITELGELIHTVESQLMVAALLIPVFLIAISIYVRKKEQLIIPVYQLLAMTMAGIWMVFGYYIAAGIMYGNFAVSAFSIPWNIMQFLVGFLLAALIYAALIKTPARKYFRYVK